MYKYACARISTHIHGCQNAHNLAVSAILTQKMGGGEKKREKNSVESRNLFDDKEELSIE